MKRLRYIGAGLVVMAGLFTLFTGCEDPQKEPDTPMGSDDTSKNYTETAFGMNLEMVYVEGGTFKMGGTEDQGDEVQDNELPVRDVSLNSFYIGKFVITQAQWERVMGTDVREQWGKAELDLGISEEGPDFPMYYISWKEATAFCERLSESTGKKYALPTEAQWEYAARGGRKDVPGRFSGSDSLLEVAWSYADTVRRLHKVGLKKPNELGLYDMSGNVYEYCSDNYDLYNPEDTDTPTGAPVSPYRVARGGSYIDKPFRCRVAYRATPLPTFSATNIGFRIVCLP